MPVIIIPAPTQNVNVLNFPAVQPVSGTVTISNPAASGVPPLGPAVSTAALPVVIASDQVVPVQFQPDQLGPAGMDASLPVTLALDQIVPVQVAPTGQQTMAQSLSVVLASDAPAGSTVIANQGTANATPWNENVAQFGGNAVVVGTGVAGAGIPRVTVSSDSFPASQAVKPDGAVWTMTGTSANVNITGGGGGTSGIPPLGSATSAGALPVVVASDQVVPVQFNQDTLGPAGTDAALPVTMALDQPPIAVAQSQLGQQPMMLSLPVTLASDQTSIVVTANQGVSPFTVAGTVSVSNFPAAAPVTGTVSVSNLPATQAVNAVALPLPANAAQETGGNLASLVSLTTQLNQLIELNRMMLATLKADNLMLASLTGASVNPSDMLEDVTFQ